MLELRIIRIKQFFVIGYWCVHLVADSQMLHIVLQNAFQSYKFAHHNLEKNDHSHIVICYTN